MFDFSYLDKGLAFLCLYLLWSVFTLSVVKLLFFIIIFSTSHLSLSFGHISSSTIWIFFQSGELFTIFFFFRKLKQTLLIRGLFNSEQIPVHSRCFYIGLRADCIHSRSVFTQVCNEWMYCTPAVYSVAVERASAIYLVV